jgi:hypothetical protein
MGYDSVSTGKLYYWIAYLCRWKSDAIFFKHFTSTIFHRLEPKANVEIIVSISKWERIIVSISKWERIRLYKHMCKATEIQLCLFQNHDTKYQLNENTLLW